MKKDNIRYNQMPSYKIRWDQMWDDEIEQHDNPLYSTVLGHDQPLWLPLVIFQRFLYFVIGILLNVFEFVSWLRVHYFQYPLHHGTIMVTCLIIFIWSHQNLLNILYLLFNSFPIFDYWVNFLSESFFLVLKTSNTFSSIS